MKIFAISDLHLAISTNKPMDIFGGNWVDYMDKIRKDWEEKVTDDDLVLIGGDISWAMKLDDGLSDLKTLSNLKGKKILIKGNHDYWWSAISKVRSGLPNGFYALQNDCIKFNNVIICGSRLWSVPGSPDFKTQDEKLYLREIERLKLSFNAVNKIREENDKVIALIHYPPFNIKKENTAFTNLFEENSVSAVVYGHLHGKYVKAEKDVVFNGVKYYLTSCDQVDNKLVEIIL